MHIFRPRGPWGLVGQCFQLERGVSLVLDMEVPKVLHPPKRENSGPKSAKFSPKMSFMAILCQILAFPAHLVPSSTKKQCNLCAWWFSDFWVPKQNGQICPKFAFWAKYWLSRPIWCHTQPKTMRTRWLGGCLRFGYQKFCCLLK